MSSGIYFAYQYDDKMRVVSQSILKSQEEVDAHREQYTEYMIRMYGSETTFNEMCDVDAEIIETYSPDYGPGYVGGDLVSTLSIVEITK